MNNTLIKGMAMLEVLARSKEPLGVTEAAARLGISKSNAHRLLRALVELGYACSEPGSGRYGASIRLWELGTAVLANLDLRKLATPVMEVLLRETRETVHLSVLDGAEVVYVHKIDSPEPVRAYTQIGGRAPAYCVATGKAMLAFESDERRSQVARHLEPHSSKTITDSAEFEREMRRVREQGYAVNRGEWRESVCGVAAPIRDPSGRIIAAIGISGPSQRVRPLAFREISEHVIRAAAGIEEAFRGTSLPGIAVAGKKGRQTGFEQALANSARPRA